MNLRVKFLLSIGLLGLLGLMLPGSIRADTLNINSINANNSPFFVDISTTNLLAQYGITLANVTPGTTVAVVCGGCAGDSIIPSSPPNVLTQFGNNNGMSYTLQFSTPLSTLTFKLAGNSKSGGSGTVVAAWSATAFNASGRVISSVGNPLFSTFSPFAPQPFTLTGPGIASVTFFTQCFNFCGTLLNIADLSAPEIKSMSPFTCTPGTTIVNVGLPTVSVPVKSAVKSAAGFQIIYNGLGLNFNIAAPTSGALCTAQSNTGTLNVSIQVAGKTALQAQSTASAALDVFPPSPTGPLTCDFASGIKNDCILNGPFDPSANYVRWSSSGFTTTLSGNCQPLCKRVSTGPLDFWVDLDALGLSPSTNSMDLIVRGAEPFVHTHLIANLPFISPYAKIQDPGAVSVLVVNSNGQTTGALPNGITTDDIPGSSYIQSDTNPAVTLSAFDAGNYEVVLTGVNSGPYQLDVLATNFISPLSETAVDNTIAQNEIVAYSLQLSDATTGPAISSMSPTAFLRDDLNGDGRIDCSDLAIVTGAYGSSTGQTGFNAWADLDGDGVINLSDLNFIAQKFAPGLTCPTLKILGQYVTFQSTLADISNSLQLGLINNQGIANALSSKINAASSAAAGGDSKTAKNVLGAFLNQLTAQSGKHITGIAPQVLQEDANSLIAQLP